MRFERLTAFLLLGSLAAYPGIATADCSDGACIPGGGPAKTDCYGELSGAGLQLNWPSFDPTLPTPKKKKEVRCFDGDAGCDVDGLVNNSCEFPVDVCLFNIDPRLPECTPATVTGVTVTANKAPTGAAALQAAANALDFSLGTAVCTAGETITVPLKPKGSGAFTKNKVVVKVSTTTDAGVDKDVLRLRCLPRKWPSHGYNRANHRATPLETAITPANVDTLTMKWDVPLGGSVTSTPTVGDRFVYVSSWDGKIYALKPKTGEVEWSFDTGSAFILGVQSSVTVTADGRVLVGDSAANVYCLDGKTGKLFWKRSIGNPAVDHIWASPAVANNRVFVGIASHSDNPCTQGRLVTLDLDTGTPLWTRVTARPRVCHDDTTITCTTDTDCPSGICVDARGAGITATVALDPTGTTVYANTVGCFTFPSIGDEDSILKLDAATGAAHWITRVNPGEQFGICSNDNHIDCGTDAACGGDMCTVKTFYHDFGFLNGPLLVQADDGLGGTKSLVISASKNGTLYALKDADGTTDWTNAVQPIPVSPAFAGFGLFNGGIGFADQRLHAALNQFTPPVLPAPKHLMAFSATTGASTWSDEIGTSWGSIAVANGIVFVGTNAASEFYAYDAASGTRLATFALPTTTSSGPSVVDGTLYIGYGIFAAGGVRAYGLP